MDRALECLMNQLPCWLREYEKMLPEKLKESLTELRLFVGQPPCWFCKGQLGFSGGQALNAQQMEELFYWVCQGSVHSHQRELCEGFVTLPGGQRVGVCGTAVYRDGSQIGLQDITSMAIRISSPWTGCADGLFRQMEMLGLQKGSFLLAGSPSSGKTTLLRDYIRILAGKNKGCAVAVLDERGELSAYDLGVTVHVLKAMPKEKAILQALRTLSPQLMVCDEIGSEAEAKALLQGLNSGCRFIGSIHAASSRELYQKEQYKLLLQKHALDAVLLLRGADAPGQVQETLLLEGGEACASSVAASFSSG